MATKVNTMKDHQTTGGHCSSGHDTRLVSTTKEILTTRKGSLGEECPYNVLYPHRVALTLDKPWRSLQLATFYLCLLLLVSLVPRATCRPHEAHHLNATEGAVRLVGGQLKGTGNVLLYYNGQWGAVCDDGWNLDSAHVVCRSIGHPYALGYTNQAYFGVPKHSIMLDDVRCYGDETSILDCVHESWGRHNCDDREAAGVFCTPKSHTPLTTPRPRRSTTMKTTTTVPTTTTTTTRKPKSKPTKRAPNGVAAVQPTVRLLTPPTHLPKHIVHTLPEPEVLPFMRDQREETVHIHEVLAKRIRQPEQRQRGGDEEEEESEENDEEEEAAEEEKGEEQEERETQTEATSNELWVTEVEQGVDPTHAPTEGTVLPVSSTEWSIVENVTDPALAEIMRRKKANIQKQIDTDKAKVKAFVDETENEVEHKVYDDPHHPKPYDLRVVEGRDHTEGRVEVHIGGVWGIICSDNWGLLEARVACHQAGLGYAKMAAKGTYFGGENIPKIVSGIRCDGLEDSLSDCYHEQVGDVTCPEVQFIAGVVCTFLLPDLVPNNTLLETSSYLQDRPMSYLQCAMEEGCAASSAYLLKEKYRDWNIQRRRLLRFSSSTWNYGTADFRPFIPKNNWEWHMCHMHYHSMEVFAIYDLLDLNHNRVAEGHKASFCLEDVECLPGKPKRYECNGYSDQGISAGCADTYKHSFDCQWIDITDVKVGKYIFRVHINPQFKVAELDYTNNAATCDLDYNGYNVEVTNCAIGDGSHMPHRPTEE